MGTLGATGKRSGGGTDGSVAGRSSSGDFEKESADGSEGWLLKSVMSALGSWELNCVSIRHPSRG